MASLHKLNGIAEEINSVHCSEPNIVAVARMNEAEPVVGITDDQIIELPRSVASQTDDSHLRLHEQDTVSRRWRRSSLAFEIVRMAAKIDFSNPMLAIFH